MDKQITIPIFPLNILPLPGESVPLHIFEQRYRDLLSDLERDDASFGIFYVAEDNMERLGAIVKLEKVLRRYDTGESDIVVKCTGTFVMLKYLKSFEGRLYAGGEVMPLEDLGKKEVNLSLREEYGEYINLLGRSIQDDLVTHDCIARAVDLDSNDRLKYLSVLETRKKQKFLSSRIKYKSFILEQEEKYKNSYTLN